MESDSTHYSTIDEYIATFPPETQRLLQEIRATIQSAAPDAVEKISYQMPTFCLNGNLIHFAAFKHHIGIYPMPSAIRAFAEKLSVYVGAKGSVRLPLDKPLPLELINQIVKFRVAENHKKVEAKSSKQKQAP
jgi:uncharacterized protein YdhG (YjbR/CyaY superfamily)